MQDDSTETSYNPADLPFAKDVYEDIDYTPVELKPLDTTIGKKFGELTVIREAHMLNAKNGRTMVCRCSCGNVILMSRHNLIYGNPDSCGCKKYRQRVKPNQQYNSLLVLEDDGTRTNGGSVKWRCRCDCGKITHTVTHNLVYGKVKTCGCGQYKKRKIESKI